MRFLRVVAELLAQADRRPRGICALAGSERTVPTNPPGGIFQIGAVGARRRIRRQRCAGRVRDPRKGAVLSAVAVRMGLRVHRPASRCVLSRHRVDLRPRYSTGEIRADAMDFRASSGGDLRNCLRIAQRAGERFTRCARDSAGDKVSAGGRRGRWLHAVLRRPDGVLDERIGSSFGGRLLCRRGRCAPGTHWIV